MKLKKTERIYIPLDIEFDLDYYIEKARELTSQWDDGYSMEQVKAYVERLIKNDIEINLEAEDINEDKWFSVLSTRANKKVINDIADKVMYELID